MYLFGAVAVVLAAGMVVLFAMLGELSARVGTAGPAGGTGTVQLLTDAAVGHAPGRWPVGIAAQADADLAIVLVLSTTCTSCGQVAAQLRDHPELADPAGWSILVATEDPAHAEAFLARYALDRLPHDVDVDGGWARAEFGVHSSPTALVFRSGRLASAVSFADLTVLRATVLDRAADDEGDAHQAENAAHPASRA